MIEPFEQPVLVVSRGLSRLPILQQTFLLAYAVGPVTARLHAALSLHVAELEIALAGAAQIVHPSYALGGADPDEANAAREHLRRAVNRKWRRPMELAIDELLATKSTPDIAAWQGALRQTALRAALLVTDDLAASIEAMRHVVELPAVREAALVQSSESVRDLMRFWISNRAASVRQHAGMIVS